MSMETLLAEAEAAPAMVRKARRGDLGTVCQLLAGAAQLPYRWVMAPEVHAGFLSRLLDVEARLDTEEILVAERGGKVVGTASYQHQGQPPWPERWAVVQALAVDEALHRRGIEGNLIDACIRFAQLDRAVALGVHLPPFAPSARWVYESRGFRRTPLWDVDLADAPGPVPLGLLAHALVIR
jgi:GNAT superfamily N-acetyltransferase